MRINIQLDEELLREAKRAIADSGQSLTQLIEESLREALARRRSARKRHRVSLPTFKGNGVRPGVELYSMSSMLNEMDRPSST